MQLYTDCTFLKGKANSLRYQYRKRSIRNTKMRTAHHQLVQYNTIQDTR